MSSLQNQLSAFKAEAASSASRLAQKRSVAAPAPLANELKRKQPDAAPSGAATPSGPPPGTVYSQPGLSGTGTNLMTQVTLAVDYLRDKDQPLPFDEIFRYLSASDIDDEGRATIAHILKTQHSKVEYDPSTKLFRFRPPHNVRSSDDLIALLQRQTTAQGIPVKELREGWSNALNAVNQLEAEHRVLVTRAAKDGTAKRVWPDDPSLHHPIDLEFRDIWNGLKPPREEEDLRKQILEYGLSPTSNVKQAKGAVTEKSDKKKRKARSGGKVTNTHMAAVLKNYEHLRK